MSQSGNRILVDGAKMQEIIENYNSCAQTFENAYLQMSNAVRVADTTWDGQASETFKAKFDQMYQNISKTSEEMQKSINDLNKALETYTETEQSVVRIVDSINVGSNPWG